MAKLINTSKPTNDDLLAAMRRLDTWVLPEQIRAALPFYQRAALGLQPVRNRLLTMFRADQIERRLLNGRKYVYRAKPPVTGAVVVVRDRHAILKNLCDLLIPVRWNYATGTFAVILHNTIMSSPDRLEQRELLLSVDCFTHPLTLLERKAVIRATQKVTHG